MVSSDKPSIGVYSHPGSPHIRPAPLSFRHQHPSLVCPQTCPGDVNARMNPNSQAPTFYNATQPIQGALPHRGCVSRSFRVTGILHIVFGGVCIVLGIAAAGLMAGRSYVATPIWGGLLFFTTTGIIGCVYHCTPKNRSIVIAFMVMSILSGVLGGIMFIMYAIIAASERNLYDYNYICLPLHRVTCYEPVWRRELVNGLIALVSFGEMGCGIVSAVIACYKACSCCKGGCCNEEQPNASVLYYASPGGAVPMMPMAAGQMNHPVYIPGGSTGPSAQPAPLVFLSASPMGQSFVPVQPLLQSQILGQQAGQAPVLPVGQALPQGGVVQSSHVNQMELVPASAVSPASPLVQPPYGAPQQPEQQNEKKLEEAEEVQDSFGEVPGEFTSAAFSDETTLI